MKFSVILPSLLADYPGAATGRNEKLIRAINSVLNQSFQDFELIVVADGCKLTEYIVNKHFPGERLKLLSVDRKGLWSNNARNAGIANVQGEYIIYIDSDDIWGKDHLQNINDQLNGEDWVWYNDMIFSDGSWQERICDIEQYGHCGTSNICHASRLNLRWGRAGYGHDYYFIQELLLHKDHRQISAAQYHVCHISKCYCV